MRWTIRAEVRKARRRATRQLSPTELVTLRTIIAEYR